MYPGHSSHKDCFLLAPQGIQVTRTVSCLHQQLISVASESSPAVMEALHTTAHAYVTANMFFSVPSVLE